MIAEALLRFPHLLSVGVLALTAVRQTFHENNMKAAFAVDARLTGEETAAKLSRNNSFHDYSQKAKFLPTQLSSFLENFSKRSEICR